MPNHPLAEVFGFPADNFSEQARRHRDLKLCPFNNRVPIVNVASVPQRSPFRYPGGKTWLIPLIRKWLCGRERPPAELVESFAGGAIVGLTAAFEGLAGHVTLVELDEDVSAVWQTIIEDAGGGEWLAGQIGSFDLTPGSIEKLLQAENSSPRQRALQTIVRNRVNHGGILAPGAGRIKQGEAGKGIRSRWYPNTLRKRILAITLIRDRLRIVNGDGLAALQQFSDRGDTVFFIDPPYTSDAGKRAGRRLYRHHELDHEALFRISASLRGDFLMTYDNNPAVNDLARQYGFDTEAVAMKNTHHARLTELLIGRNLDWLR